MNDAEFIAAVRKEAAVIQELVNNHRPQGPIRNALLYVEARLTVACNDRESERLNETVEFRERSP